MNARVLSLLLRPAPGQFGVIALPAVAFALVTALVLTVFGGAQKFWTWTDGDGLIYQMLAAIALVLLVVPLATLGGAAARLSARRRDERLSTLRLLGVSPASVVGATVLESTLIAFTGALCGLVLYLIVAPGIALIQFRGEPLGFDAVMLSPLSIAAVIFGVIALATISAVIGLHRVVISPLGVRTRAVAPRVHWMRAVIAVLVIAGAFGVLLAFPGAADFAVTIVVIAAMFAAALGVLNLIGPWLIKVHARAGLRRATRPDRLIAARLVLESPKAAWRQVSGISMASFMAVFAGTGVALVDTTSGPDAGATAMLAADIHTGLIVTLLASFLMVAVSVGVNQAASILDHGDLHQSLHRLGMPVGTMDSARTRAVMSPLLFTAIGSALCAAVLMLPLIGLTLIIAPLSLITIAAVVAAGITIVWLSTRVTRPLLNGAFQAA